jgi:C1A family cysteine protease
MKSHNNRNRKNIRRMAAALACALLLSDIPVTQLMAAPADTTVQTVETPGEENENGTGDGSGDKSENGGENGSCDENGIGDENGSGGESGTGDENGTGGESGSDDENRTGDESGSGDKNGTGDENDSGDQDSDGSENEGGDSEEAAEEDADETDDEETLAVDAEIDLEDEEETDGLTEEEIAAQKALEPDYLPNLEVFKLPEHYVAEEGPYSIMGTDTLPSAYDSRKEGILPAIRNQNPWGTCWAFATLAGFETSLVKQGIASGSSIDLSERHLAYFVYNTGYDRLGNASGDTIVSTTNDFYLENGGNIYYAIMKLMNWQGAAAESTYPYSTSLPAALSQDTAQDDSYHLKDCYLLDTKAADETTINNVKALVKQYGCVTWDYYANDKFMNYTTKGYYKPADGTSSVNHAIVVVGWDDSFPKENFNTEPSQDGAWIVRNSWGSSWAEDGYFYISYDDSSLGSGNPAAAIVADAASDYDNNYFNSNTLGFSYQPCNRAAQVYEVKGLTAEQEVLKAVSFMLYSTNTAYSIQVYKNPTKNSSGVVTNPESGTAMLSTPVTGKTAYAGVYTVNLSEDLVFDKGDDMAVVITFTDSMGGVAMDSSGSTTSGAGELTWTNEVEAGESLFHYGTSWYDCGTYYGRSFRINLLTEDAGTVRLTKTVLNAATADSDTTVTLTWDKNTQADGYYLYRSTIAGNTGMQCAKIENPETTSYQDTGLTPGETYYYSIAAYKKENGEEKKSSISTQKSVRTLPAKPVISELTTDADGAVLLCWEQAAGAEGYIIERSEEADASEASFSQLADIQSGSTVTYTDENVKVGDSRTYRITAYNADINGKTQYGKTSEPGKVSVNPASVSILSVSAVNEKKLRVTWSGTEGETYEIYRSVGEEGEYTLLKGGLADCSYEDEAVITGKTYYYKVLASINGLQSELSRTKAKAGQCKPDKAVLVKASYDTIVIESNTDFEYGIGTVAGDKTGKEYCDAKGSTLTFEGLAENTRYYIAVRTKNAVTGETPVYSAELSVTTSVEAQLVLNPSSAVVSKGNRVNINVSVTPENVHYQKMEWQGYYYAKDTNKKTYYTTKEDENTYIILGSDQKEILRIADNVLYATGESTDKELWLEAAAYSSREDAEPDITGDMAVHINVPVTGLTMQATEPNSQTTLSIANMTVGQSANVGVSYTPSYNADDTTVTWKTSNSRVVSVKDNNESTVTVTAEGTGECTLTASTADGVSVVQKITVNKGESVYGILVSQESLDGKSVSAGENGSWTVEGKAYPLTYELELDDETKGSVMVTPYLLKDSGKQMEGETVVGGILRAAAIGEVTWRSADASVATVDTEGEITAVGAGETVIYACDTGGSSVYGSCQVTVSGSDKQEEDTGSSSVAKTDKLSAVQKTLQLQNYENDSQSSCSVQVKKQDGTIVPAGEFTYTADSDLCLVDENGVVTANPEGVVTGNKKVKITAALKNDVSKRKVDFNVTVLAADQVDTLQLLKVTDNPDLSVAGDEQTEAAGDAQTWRYDKNGANTITFLAKAWNRQQELMEDAEVKFSVSDSAIASLKVNRDKTVTLTMKKPGRVNLICTAADAFQEKTSVQILSVSTAPIVSASQVNLNKMSAPVEKNTSTEGDAAEMTNDQTAEYVSDSFTVYAPNGADMSAPTITKVAKGKEVLADFSAFRVRDNDDASYSIAIEQTFAKEIKNNTTYTVTMSTNISGMKDIGDAQIVPEEFSVKVKVISKEPTVKVTASAINLSMKQDSDRRSLLVLKAPDTVTKVEIPKGQASGFDNYFTVEHINGRWYLQFKDNTESYDQKSIKGTLSITVDGYLPVTKTITVKTPTTAQNIKQQSVPSINTGISRQAEISLYNGTQKETVTGQLEVIGVDSKKLNVWGQNDGTLRAEILDGSVINNGEKLTATVKIMEKENGTDCWTAPVSVKISVKVYTKDPTLSMKSKTLTLNKQLPKETAETTLTLNCQNVNFKDDSQWKISLYDSREKKYVEQTEDTGWLAVSYDEASQSLKVGFAVKQSTGKTSDETAAEGADLSAVEAGKSYKFRISNLVNDFDTLYQDFTVKVIDTQPTATVKMSGKLDLVNRDNATLTGKITLKNVPSGVKNVTILNDEKTEANSYFKASKVTNSAFQITMTDQGKAADLTTAKLTLPIRIELENGTELTLTSSLSFKPTQSTPKVIVPAAQTIYKSVSNLTRDYNLGNGLTQGVEISKIEVMSVPTGFGVIAKNGHVLVTLNDRGIKAGTYKIKVNIYFKGEAAVSGYPDGKPVSKVISVKVTE